MSCNHGGPGPGAPGAPPSTQDQDALWQLAPQGAKLGVVVSARGVTLLEHGALAIRGLLAQAPDLAPIKQALDAELTQGTGTAQPMLADYGMSHDKGLAVFMAPDESPIIVLPVVDRAKFIARFHGTTAGDTDTLDGHPCKQLGPHYVCVKNAAMLTALGKSGLDTARRAIAVRGDVEVVTVGAFGAKTSDVAGVIQLADGAFVVRGTVTRIPDDVTSVIGAPIDLHGDPTSAGFGAVDLSPFLDKAPPEPLGNNVTLADLAKSLAGSMALTAAAGTSRFELHLPVRDPGPAKALIEHCNAVPALAMVGAKLDGKTCHVTVPKTGITVDAVVASNEITLTAHGFGGADTGAAQKLPATAIGELIAGAPWSIGLYGRGSVMSAVLPKELTSDLPAEAAMAFRAISTINEAGVGVRKDRTADGTSLSFVLGIRTIWANPDDVVQKLIAITPDQIISGAARDTARKIADASPSSLFAADFRAGVGGGVVLAMPAGILAAIAIPAFTEYTARSKKAGAQLAAPPQP